MFIKPMTISINATTARHHNFNNYKSSKTGNSISKGTTTLQREQQQEAARCQSMPIKIFGTLDMSGAENHPLSFCSSRFPNQVRLVADSINRGNGFPNGVSNSASASVVLLERVEVKLSSPTDCHNSSPNSNNNDATSSSGRVEKRLLLDKLVLLEPQSVGKSAGWDSIFKSQLSRRDFSHPQSRDPIILDGQTFFILNSNGSGNNLPSSIATSMLRSVTSVIRPNANTKGGGDRPVNWSQIDQPVSTSNPPPQFPIPDNISSTSGTFKKSCQRRFNNNSLMKQRSFMDKFLQKDDEEDGSSGSSYSENIDPNASTLRSIWFTAVQVNKQGTYLDINGPNATSIDSSYGYGPDQRLILKDLKYFQVWGSTKDDDDNELSKKGSNEELEFALEDLILNLKPKRDSNGRIEGAVILTLHVMLQNNNKKGSGSRLLRLNLVSLNHNLLAAASNQKKGNYSSKGDIIPSLKFDDSLNASRALIKLLGSDLFIHHHNNNNSSASKSNVPILLLDLHHQYEGEDSFFNLLMNCPSLTKGKEESPVSSNGGKKNTFSSINASFKKKMLAIANQFGSGLGGVSGEGGGNGGGGNGGGGNGGGGNGGGIFGSSSFKKEKSTRPAAFDIFRTGSVETETTCDAAQSPQSQQLLPPSISLNNNINSPTLELSSNLMTEIERELNNTIDQVNNEQVKNTAHSSNNNVSRNINSDEVLMLSIRDLEARLQLQRNLVSQRDLKIQQLERNAKHQTQEINRLKGVNMAFSHKYESAQAQIRELESSRQDEIRLALSPLLRQSKEEWEQQSQSQIAKLKLQLEEQSKLLETVTGQLNETRDEFERQAKAWKSSKQELILLNQQLERRLEEIENQKEISQLVNSSNQNVQEKVKKQKWWKFPVRLFTFLTKRRKQQQRTSFNKPQSQHQSNSYIIPSLDDPSIHNATTTGKRQIYSQNCRVIKFKKSNSHTSIYSIDFTTMSTSSSTTSLKSQANTQTSLLAIPEIEATTDDDDNDRNVLESSSDFVVPAVQQSSMMLEPAKPVGRVVAPHQPPATTRNSIQHSKERKTTKEKRNERLAVDDDHIDHKRGSTTRASPVEDSVAKAAREFLEAQAAEFEQQLQNETLNESRGKRMVFDKNQLLLLKNCVEREKLRKKEQQVNEQQVEKDKKLGLDDLTLYFSKIDNGSPVIENELNFMRDDNIFEPPNENNDIHVDDDADYETNNVNDQFNSYVGRSGARNMQRPSMIPEQQVDEFEDDYGEDRMMPGIQDDKYARNNNNGNKFISYNSFPNNHVNNNPNNHVNNKPPPAPTKHNNNNNKKMQNYAYQIESFNDNKNENPLNNNKKSSSSNVVQLTDRGRGLREEILGTTTASATNGNQRHNHSQSNNILKDRQTDNSFNSNNNNQRQNIYGNAPNRSLLYPQPSDNNNSSFNSSYLNHRIGGKDPYEPGIKVLEKLKRLGYDDEYNAAMAFPVQKGGIAGTQQLNQHQNPHSHIEIDENDEVDIEDYEDGLIIDKENLHLNPNLIFNKDKNESLKPSFNTNNLIRVDHSAYEAADIDNGNYNIGSYYGVEQYDQFGEQYNAQYGPEDGQEEGQQGFYLEDYVENGNYFSL